MRSSKLMLAAAGWANIVIAVLHVALGFAGAKVNSFFGAPKSVLQLIEQGSVLVPLMCIAMAGVFTIWGLYGLSGAGFIRRLPFLRTGLLLIGGIYFLRGFLLIPEAVMLFRAPRFVQPQFIVFDIVSLATGIFFLAGAYLSWPRLEPEARG